WYHADTAAGLQVTPARSGPAAQVLVVFPGFAMPGDLLSQAFAPYLGPGDAMIVIRYAQRGIDIGEIYDAVAAEGRRLAPAALRVYGGSMGGMCARDFLDRYARDGTPLGRAVLVLDTAPSSVADVRQPRSLFGVTAWYRGGPVSSAVWAVAAEQQSRPPGE